MPNSEDLLKQMYDNDLAAKKAALQSGYNAAVSDLNKQKANNQRNAEQNVRLTKAEADKAAVNRAEYYEAAGLSSGARAQARVASENQLASDLAAIRAAQQQADYDVERQRGLLSQQFAAAIREAQANNDMARAQALYEQAKEAEANLLAQQNGDSLLASEEAERKAGQAKLDQQYKDMLAFYKETAQYDKWEQLIQQGPPVYETQREKAARIEQETISALKAQFPSGSIYDRSLWASLMKQYGDSWLSKNGFHFAATPTATTPGTGGRTQDVANINW